MDELQNSMNPSTAQSAATPSEPAEQGDVPAEPVFSVQEPPPAEPPAAEAAQAVQEPAKPDEPASDLKEQKEEQKDEQPAAPAEASLSEANKLRICCKALKNIEREISTIIRLLESNAAMPPGEAIAPQQGPAVVKDTEVVSAAKNIEGRVIEGVFDGQNMVGSDGKIYTVPANYASKSKLVEGDLLKLTITPKGSFIYKQIGPIERSRVIGSLGFDPTIGEYYATTENRRWSIIKASVTYYKGEPGDEVVLLVPKNAPSKWAAVENIIKRNPLA